MVDDIRVRGCGKSGIKSVYKTKMGHGQAKPVTVHGFFYTYTQLNIHVNTQDTLTRGSSRTILFKPTSFSTFKSLPFTNIMI